jgi:hypothetical protein
MRARTSILTAAVVIACLLSTAVALAANGSVKKGKWSGTTSQSLPLSFTVGKSGATFEVLNFEPTFKAQCTKKGSPGESTPEIDTNAGRDLAISKRAFGGKGIDGTLRATNTVIATGTDNVTGTFTSAHSAKGTYSVLLNFKSGAPDDLGGYRCTTGTLKWQASSG